jgi:hypothetical protein
MTINDESTVQRHGKVIKLSRTIAIRVRQIQDMSQWRRDSSNLEHIMSKKWSQLAEILEMMEIFGLLASNATRSESLNNIIFTMI